MELDVLSGTLRRDRRYVYPNVYTSRCYLTKSTKVFWSGNSQAVRIPKEFLIDSDEVEIRKRGDTILLRPRKRTWAPLLKSLDKFSDDFMGRGRGQEPVQKRKKIFG
jgi:antitoxin VapB